MRNEAADGHRAAASDDHATPNQAVACRPVPTHGLLQGLDLSDAQLDALCDSILAAIDF